MDTPTANVLSDRMYKVASTVFLLDKAAFCRASLGDLLEGEKDPELAMAAHAEAVAEFREAQKIFRDVFPQQGAVRGLSRLRALRPRRILGFLDDGTLAFFGQDAGNVSEILGIRKTCVMLSRESAISAVITSAEDAGKQLSALISSISPEDACVNLSTADVLIKYCNL